MGKIMSIKKGTYQLKGEWENGYLNGRGELKDFNGGHVNGIWENGVIKKINKGEKSFFISQKYLLNPMRNIEKNYEKFLHQNILLDEHVMKLINPDDLKSPEYQVAVLGTMKAGKSTFINALIGDDLMPSENSACTLTTTSITHCQTPRNEVVKRFTSGKEQVIKGRELSNSFHEEVKKTRQVVSNERFTYHTNQVISSLHQYQESAIKFKLVDTPGINEMSGLGVDRIQIEESFKQQLLTTNFVIFVFDYKYYKAQENIDILNLILEYRPDLIANKNIAFIVNKVDLITFKDDSLESVLSDIKLLLGSIGIKTNRVYPISAKKALIGRYMRKYPNSTKYSDDVLQLTPIIEKEIEGEIYEVKMPANQLDSYFERESGVLIFEEAILKDLYENLETNYLNNIFHKQLSVMEYVENMLQNKRCALFGSYHEVNSQLLQLHLKEMNLSSIESQYSMLEQELEGLTLCPSYEEVKEREFVIGLYDYDLTIDYFNYYDDYSSFRSSAEKQGESVFYRFKNSFSLDYNAAYKHYHSELEFENVSGNFFYDMNQEVNKLITKLRCIYQELCQVMELDLSFKIFDPRRVQPKPLIPITFSNTEGQYRDQLNVLKIHIDEDEREGWFGMYKTYYGYDISTAVYAEIESVELALERSATIFFKDYYEKKYVDYLDEVRATTYEELGRFRAVLVNCKKEFEKKLLEKERLCQQRELELEKIYELVEETITQSRIKY